MARLIKTFSHEQFKNKNVLIIDDEADYASVGFKRTKEEGIESNTTTNQIDELRKLIQKSSRSCLIVFEDGFLHHNKSIGIH
jgi:hypothetical protein